MTHYTIRIVVHQVIDGIEHTEWVSPALGNIKELSEATYLAGKASAEIIHELKIKGIFECEP